MATDSVMLIITTVILNYLVIYRQDKLIGSIIFILAGVGAYLLGSDTYYWAAALMALGVMSAALSFKKSP